jgi:hypothetical protein
MPGRVLPLPFTPMTLWLCALPLLAAGAYTGVPLA